MPTKIPGVDCTAMPLAPRTSHAPGVKLLRPHQLGWLRRPELDRPGNEIWEQPDGKLYAHDPQQGPLLLNWYRYPRPQITETGRP